MAWSDAARRLPTSKIVNSADGPADHKTLGPESNVRSPLEQVRGQSHRNRRRRRRQRKRSQTKRCERLPNENRYRVLELRAGNSNVDGLRASRLKLRSSLLNFQIGGKPSGKPILN